MLLVSFLSLVLVRQRVIDLTDHDGMTSLSCAIVALFKLLLDAGANPKSVEINTLPLCLVMLALSSFYSK